MFVARQIWSHVMLVQPYVVICIPQVCTAQLLFFRADANSGLLCAATSDRRSLYFEHSQCLTGALFASRIVILLTKSPVDEQMQKMEEWVSATIPNSDTKSSTTSLIRRWHSANDLPEHVWGTLRRELRETKGPSVLVIRDSSTQVRRLFLSFFRCICNRDRVLAGVWRLYSRTYHTRQSFDSSRVFVQRNQRPGLNYTSQERSSGLPFWHLRFSVPSTAFLVASNQECHPNPTSRKRMCCSGVTETFKCYSMSEIKLFPACRTMPVSGQSPTHAFILISVAGSSNWSFSKSLSFQSIRRMSLVL